MNVMERVFTIFEPKIVAHSIVYTYSYNDGKASFLFREEHQFPFAIQDSKAVRALAIATSISYFKLHLAEHIHIEWSLNETEIHFWEWLFRNGFSELVYHNKLSWDAVNQIIISSSTKEAFFEPYSKTYTRKAIVGIGGGKDSSVAVELLKQINVPATGFATKIRTTPLLQENASALGIPLLEVTRKTDPQLLTLKEQVYLGHIPVSLIYALTGVVLAEHEESSYVVVANETSADESNTEWHGKPVNHQWSKTTEFEKMVQSFILSSVNPHINYFSILRPIGGLVVTKFFAKMCQHVFSSFSSCNKNFTIEKSGSNRWCGTCAKCLGTYILLSVSVPLEKRVEIFGSDLYQNTHLDHLFKELLGLSPVKPFDCVATRGEMCLATTLDPYIKISPLGKTLSLRDWKKIEVEAVKAKHWLYGYRLNFIPEEINVKLRAIIQS